MLVSNEWYEWCANVMLAGGVIGRVSEYDKRTSRDLGIHGFDEFQKALDEGTVKPIMSLHTDAPVLQKDQQRVMQYLTFWGFMAVYSLN